MNWIDDILHVLRPRPANVLATKELQEAQRTLLHYQSAQEYATAMVQFESDRIARLQRYVSAGNY